MTKANIMAYQIPITISEAIRKIEADQILLPAFQREFKWSYLNIEHLFDSLMRNYPIGLFVFWKVEKELAENYRFYSFSKEYKEEHETYCHEIFYFRKGSIYSVLDGQQRLSALYIGLKGSYAYKDYGVEWEDTTDSTLTRHLYLNISKEHSEETRLYEFKFLKRFFTNEKEIYETKYDTWFKVGEILNYTDEEEQNLDRALDIYKIINSDRDHLNSTDLINKIL